MGQRGQISISRYLLLGICVFLASTAFAQQAGHYVGGVTGLEDGSATPPGVYASYLPLVQRIDSLKGPNGNTILRPDINLVAHMVIFAGTSTKHLLGGCGQRHPAKNLLSELRI